MSQHQAESVLPRLRKYFFVDVPAIVREFIHHKPKETPPLLGCIRPRQRRVLDLVDDKPTDINLPNSVEMEITEAPEGLRGDTASAATKSATTESGMVIQVPLFVKQGDRIKINTADKSYQGRV